MLLGHDGAKGEFWLYCFPPVFWPWGCYWHIQALVSWSKQFLPYSFILGIEWDNAEWPPYCSCSKWMSFVGALPRDTHFSGTGPQSTVGNRAQTIFAKLSRNCMGFRGKKKSIWKVELAFHFSLSLLIQILGYKSINSINVHVMPWIAHFTYKWGVWIA